MRKHLYAGVGTAVLAVLAAGLESTPAAAQFVCVGNATGATVPPATADGAGANASGGVSNVACGSSANASGSGDISSNTATGTASNASGDGSLNTATGNSANASGDGSRNTAIGNSANASGDGVNNTAVGTNSVATGANASAFGNEARAEFGNSAAFGNGAVATRENQQVFGNKDNTYTMSGITSAASKVAQGAPTHLVTSNASGDLAAHTFADLGLASPGDIAGLQSQINSLGRRDRELADGIAISLALAQPFFHAGQTFAMNVGWGNFDGSNAFGVTAAGIIDRGSFGRTSTVTLHGGVGVSTDRGMVAGRAGLSFGW